jgi:hypothetical protein
VNARAMWHPTRQQLLDHAESLALRGAPVSASLAGHVQRCARCRGEVARIRESIDVTAAAGPLEPSRDLTAQILLAAQQKQPRHGRWGTWLRPLRAVMVVLAVVVAGAGGTFVFAVVLGVSQPRAAVPPGPAMARPAALSHAEHQRMRQETALLQAAPAPGAPFARAHAGALEAAAQRARADGEAARAARAWNPRLPAVVELHEDALAREHAALRHRYTRLPR